MSMNFALGLALGQKMAERSGVTSLDARRRAGIVLGATGLTPPGLVVANAFIRSSLAAQQDARPDKPNDGVPAADGGLQIDQQEFVRQLADAVADGVESGLNAALPEMGAKIEAGVDAGIAARLDPDKLAAALAPAVRSAIEGAVNAAMKAAAGASGGASGGGQPMPGSSGQPSSGGGAVKP